MKTFLIDMMAQELSRIDRDINQAHEMGLSDEEINALREERVEIKKMYVEMINEPDDHGWHMIHDGEGLKMRKTS